MYLHDLPFNFIFYFSTLNNVIVIALLKNRFNRIETHKFNSVGCTFSGCTFCCNGRCGARASCYGYWWCLKCGRCRRNNCCGRTNGWHCWRCCDRHLTNHYSSWATLRTRFVMLLLFITHTELWKKQMASDRFARGWTCVCVPKNNNNERKKIDSIAFKWPRSPTEFFNILTGCL